MTGDDYQLIRDLPVVKGLVRLDVEWDRLDWRKLAEHLRADALVILRLFYPGRLEAWEFVSRAARELPPVLLALGDREVLIEIHNEPNHAEGIEGWGHTQEQAADFAMWYAVVYEALSAAGFQGLGWPGLALGNWVHGERVWSKVCRDVIRASSWVGCHVYWQRGEEMHNAALGMNWLHYRQKFPDQRLIVTEVGNSSCHNPELPQMTPEIQAAQYVDWCRTAHAGGVDAATFYMLGGSEDWRGFRLFPETVRALAYLDHELHASA